MPEVQGYEVSFVLARKIYLATFHPEPMQVSWFVWRAFLRCPLRASKLLLQKLPSTSVLQGNVYRNLLNHIVNYPHESLKDTIEEPMNTNWP